MMTAAEVSPSLVRLQLDAMDALLDTEAKWTHEVGARTATGKAINPNDPQATCWCLMGASYKVTHSAGYGKKDADAIHNAVLMTLKDTLVATGHNCITIGEFNDDSDFAAIKALIAKARETVESEPDAGSGSAAAA